MSLSIPSPLGLLVFASLRTDFFSHGYPKLAHSGAEMQDSLWHRSAGYFVYIAGVLESSAPFLVLGLFTRAAALLLAIEMGCGHLEGPQYRSTWPCTITNSLSRC